MLFLFIFTFASFLIFSFWAQFHENHHLNNPVSNALPESEASANITAIVIDIELIFHRKANVLHIPTKLADCGVDDIFSFMHTTPETRSKFKKANLAEAEKVKRSHTKGQKSCPSVDFREQLKDSLEANFVVEQVEETEDFRMFLKPPTFSDTQSQKIVAAPYLAKGFLLRGTSTEYVI